MFFFSFFLLLSKWKQVQKFHRFSCFFFSKMKLVKSTCFIFIWLFFIPCCCKRIILNHGIAHMVSKLKIWFYNHYTIWLQLKNRYYKLLKMGWVCEFLYQLLKKDLGEDTSLPLLLLASFDKLTTLIRKSSQGKLKIFCHFNSATSTSGSCINYRVVSLRCRIILSSFSEMPYISDFWLIVTLSV